MQDYIIIARSARSLAISAKRAGYHVHVLDCYTDTDTCQVSISVKQLHYSDHGFIKEEVLDSVYSILSDYPRAIVVAGAGFEMNPALIEQINQVTIVYSNSVSTFQRLQNKDTFFQLLDQLAIGYPDVSTEMPQGPDFLAKKMASMGGEHVYWADTLSHWGQQYYFQQYIAGQACSVVFISDGYNMRLLGFNKLLRSDQFEDRPFLYSGVCVWPDISDKHYNEIKRITAILVREFSLKGLCGIDYILTEDEQIYILEVNPRPPASFELHERIGNLFSAHISCFNTKIGKYLKQSCPALRAYVILYAESELVIPCNFLWPSWVSDIPVAGRCIKQCEPICTIHAEAETISDIDAQLMFRRKRLNKDLFNLK